MPALFYVDPDLIENVESNKVFQLHLLHILNDRDSETAFDSDSIEESKASKIMI